MIGVADGDCSPSLSAEFLWPVDKQVNLSTGLGLGVVESLTNPLGVGVPHDIGHAEPESFWFAGDIVDKHAVIGCDGGDPIDISGHYSDVRAATVCSGNSVAVTQGFRIALQQ